MSEVQAAAGKLGLKVGTSEIHRAEEIAPAFDALKGRADALYVCGDAAQHLKLILVLFRHHRATA